MERRRRFITMLCEVRRGDLTVFPITAAGASTAAAPRMTVWYQALCQNAPPPAPECRHAAQFRERTTA
jgi:hypothetical protein